MNDQLVILAVGRKDDILVWGVECMVIIYKFKKQKQKNKQACLFRKQ